MTKLFFIWGLQRSGTNFFERSMIMNFNVKCINNTQRGYGWKHIINPSVDHKELEIGKGVSFIISKNPYTWIESLCCRNSVDWDKRQTNYPASKIANVDARLVMGKNKMNVVELAKAWRDYHNNWLIDPKIDLSKSKHIIYEDLLDRNKRQELFGEIREKFEFSRAQNNNKEWIFPKIGSISQSKDFTEDRMKYYNKGVPSQMTQYMLDHVNEILEEDLLEKVGYKQIKELSNVE